VTPIKPSPSPGSDVIFHDLPLQSKIKAHYAGLDGLRGVAALCVVTLHITEYFRLSVVPEHAYLAVDFFFLLSGFVISRAYDARLDRGMSWTDFLLVRLIRLYPMIVLGIILGTSVLVVRWWVFHDLTPRSIIWAVVSAATLTPTPALLYFRPWAFPVDNPLWSLSLEFLVNVIYAKMFFSLHKSVLFVIVATGAFAIFFAAMTIGSLEFGFRWDDFLLGLVRVVFPFFSGICLARYLNGTRNLRHLGKVAPLALLVILFFPGAKGWVFDVAATLLLFPIIVYVTSRLPPHDRIDRFSFYIGELSYPLYVIHFPIVVAMSNAAHQSGIIGWRLSLAALVCLLSTAIVACLSLIFYDRPIRRTLSGVLRNK
jgi:peptidoglycan/LPS O-acetylase OafA/YrhL